MKRQLTQIVLSAGLSVLFGSLALSAEAQRDVADIPFAFHANGRVLPAGKYEVKQVNSAGTFQVSDVNGHSIFMSAPLQKRGDPYKPRLTFAAYGDTRVLSQIWMLGDENGHMISNSALDKELPRKIGMASMISVPLKAIR